MGQVAEKRTFGDNSSMFLQARYLSYSPANSIKALKIEWHWLCSSKLKDR